MTYVFAARFRVSDHGLGVTCLHRYSVQKRGKGSNIPAKIIAANAMPGIRDIGNFDLGVNQLRLMRHLWRNDHP